MKTFSQFLTEIMNDTLSTQLPNGNQGTYLKTGKVLSDILKPNSKILSIGSGAASNAESLHKGLGENHTHTVHEQEPNPGKRPENKQPLYQKEDGSDIPSDNYHAVVHHNVVNVLEPEIRNKVMETSFRTVKDGGHIIIGSRAWKGDVDKIKNYEESDEPKSKWVVKKRKGGEIFHSYQKGFDGDELKQYAEDYAKKHGHQVVVQKLKGITANGIHIHVIKKGT